MTPQIARLFSVNWENTNQTLLTSPWVGGTPGYGAPEKDTLEGVDERSDVFSVGVTLLDGIEGGKLDPPNKCLRQDNAVKNRKGDVVRKPGTYSAETVYTKFMSSILAQEKKNRATPMEAKNLDFLHENMRMLDDDAAKEVIEKAIKEAIPPGSIDNQKRKMGLNELVKAFQANPNLEGYARLQNAGKANPESPNLKAYLEKKIGRFQAKIEQDVKKSAMELITNATWFDGIKRISEKALKAPKVIKSGVDKDGARLPHERLLHIDPQNTDPKNTAPDRERTARSALESLASYVEIEDLRRYASASEKFLLNVGTLNN